MHATARQAIILQSLSRAGTAAVSELAREMQVSDETIRRDIKALASRGLLEKVHGGAALPHLLNEPAFQKRLATQADAKQAIAQRIAAEVVNGDALLLDTGSTTTYVARALANHSDLLVITNGTEIARTLAQGGRNRVLLAGGEVRGDDGAVFGPEAVRFIENFRVRLAILSIGALDMLDGLMVFHTGEAEFSRAAMRRAQRVIIAADHSKFGAQASVRVAPLASAHVIVTDRQPPAPFPTLLKESDVELDVVG